jgi:hypothetical protein
MATCHHRHGHDGSCHGSGGHVSCGDCSNGVRRVVSALLSHDGDEYASPDVEQG